MNKPKSYEIDIAGKKITFETGKLAQQATSSVLARVGDTMILVTVVAGRETDIGYFPLSVEYTERLYAGGRIKGSRWVKREGRPTDESILTARLIDRSIRPLFPKEYKREVQVVVTLLSVDGENRSDVLAINAVSAALAISPIPWNGPIAAVRMGAIMEKNGEATEYIVNPTNSELDLADLDLVVSQTKEKTHMLEAGAKQVPEAIALEAIKQTHEHTNKMIAAIETMVKEIGQPKDTVVSDTVYAELVQRVEKSFMDDIAALIPVRATKEAGAGTETEDVIKRIQEQEAMQNPTEPVDKKLIAKTVEYLFFKAIRHNTLNKSKRPDGRKLDEIRPISAAVSILPRVHGSGLFQRGDTQGLTVVTLGAPRMEQLIESAEGEESKRYIHHYSMPPYSVGEAGRMFGPSRREIGHGALAERALEAVIPTQEKFPYTIRIVSEILSSNGSTSMAATCGSTLALMDAGVPILAPVAGIAMGMVSTDEKYVILTDILGLEDFSGDMDFKVAGTESGVTAIQLDVKILGLTDEQIAETFEGAKTGRLFILGKMTAAISEYRKEVSAFAPKIEQLKIPVEKIGEVIGPGGRVIKSIIAETGANVDVEDDGTVTISGTADADVDKATDWVKNLVREVTAGEEFEGTVKRILTFGAFVEILPGKEGMVHVSQMSSEYVKDPNDVVSLGDRVKVKVKEIDDQGRINLTMLLNGEEKAPRGPRGGRGGEGERPSQNRVPREDQLAEQKPHPLTMQFRRERMEKRSGMNRGPRRGGFRKPR